MVVVVKVGGVWSRLGLTKILDLVTLSSIEIVAFSEMMWFSQCDTWWQESPEIWSLRLLAIFSIELFELFYSAANHLAEGWERHAHQVRSQKLQANETALVWRDKNIIVITFRNIFLLCSHLPTLFTSKRSIV